MIITQITDPHIAPEGERPFQVDTRAHFLKTLDLQKREKPDLLVLTGDLSYRYGNESTYLWIRNQLNETGIPFRVIGGNHDDSSLLAKVFKLEEHLHNSIELYYEEKVPGYHLIYLDSSIGSLSKMQWKWLSEKIDDDPKLHKVLFIHHPPVSGGVPYMDSQYPFKEQEEFQELLGNIDKHITAICGHYHVEKTILRTGVQVFITPSPFFNIDDREIDFKQVGNRPCYRRIKLGPHSLETSVFYG